MFWQYLGSILFTAPFNVHDIGAILGSSQVGLFRFRTARHIVFTICYDRALCSESAVILLVKNNTLYNTLHPRFVFRYSSLARTTSTKAKFSSGTVAALTAAQHCNSGYCIPCCCTTKEIFPIIYRWVTDGQYHVTGTLEVQASEPFLERINQTRLTVRRGYFAVLDNEQLGMISNLDYDSSELAFYLLDEPQHGSVQVNGTAIGKMESFTQEDLLSGKVTYQSRNETDGKDWFKVRASLRRVEYECIVEVRTFPESYWQPLKVIQNQLVTVEEGTFVYIYLLLSKSISLSSDEQVRVSRSTNRL